MKELIKEIQDAKKLFDLKDNITLDRIKKKYRQLAKKYHPDSGRKSDAQFKKINQAYRLLMGYCLKHGCEFKISEIKKNSLGKEYYEHLFRFYDDWWDKLDL